MPNPSMHMLREWTQAIRDLSHPFLTEADFKVAVAKLGAIKTNIPDIDALFEKLTTISGDKTTDLIYWDDKTLLTTPVNKKTMVWQYLIRYLRGGEINKGFKALGTSFTVSADSEQLLQSFLEFITPEFYNSRYDFDYAIASKKYPDLMIKPSTGTECKSKLKLPTIRMIESAMRQLKAKYPNNLIINGMYSCFSMDPHVDLYDRLVDSMIQTNGCYLLHNSNGQITSCKIGGRTCNSTVNKSCLCKTENGLCGTSNPYSFMQYLLYGKTNNDTDAIKLLVELNDILTVKLTDQTSLAAIMENYKECAKVYHFQLKTYKDKVETWNPCTVVPDANDVIACDNTLPYYVANSANNALPTEYNTFKYQHIDLLSVFIDLTYGTQIDIMGIRPIMPINRDETETKPEPKNKIWIWVVIIGVFIIVIIAIILVLMKYLKHASKNISSGYAVMVN